jgi:hypothetical protein
MNLNPVSVPILQIRRAVAEPYDGLGASPSLAILFLIIGLGGYPFSSTSHTMLKSGFASNDETIGGGTGEGSLLK